MKDWKAIGRTFKARDTFNSRRLSTIASVILLIFVGFLEYNIGFNYTPTDYTAKSKEFVRDIADDLVNEGLYNLPRYDNLVIKSTKDRVDIIEAIINGLKYVDSDEIQISFNLYEWKVNTVTGNKIYFDSNESERIIVASYNKEGSIGISTVVPFERRVYSGLWRMFIVVFGIGLICAIASKIISNYIAWRDDFNLQVDYYREKIDEEEREELERDRQTLKEQKEKEAAEKAIDEELEFADEDEVDLDESFDGEEVEDESLENAEEVEDESLENAEEVEDKKVNDETIVDNHEKDEK